MSSDTFNKLWDEARDVLSEAANFDNFLQSGNPEISRKIFHDAISEIYYKYVISSNILQECYDQIVHPQKRLLIRKLLDGCLGRVIELKTDLENVDLSEHSYNDDVLLKLRISPIDAELKVPRYFRNERLEDIKYKRQFVDDVLKTLGFEKEEGKKAPMTELEAIKIIQIHERARQGRLRCIFMREIRLLKETGKQEKKEELNLVSALMIQKMWRGFIARRVIRKRKLDEMVLIGMIPPPPPPTGSEILERIGKMQEEKRKVQAEHEEEFIKAMESIETKLREKRGVVIMESITDEIRHLFREYFDLNKAFPEFPTDEEGGSKTLIQNTDMDAASAPSSASSKKGKEPKKEKGKKGKAEKTKEEKKSPGFLPNLTQLLPNIMQGDQEYEDVWKQKDESNNPEQVHDEDMIYNEKYNLIEDEVRLVADEMMRAELDLLQAALDKDKGQKTKKKKPKKKGRGKKGKKKKEKDLTPDRTTESLFEELVTNGIIKKYPETSFDSYIGEMSYAAYDFRNLEKNPKPSIGDIRNLVKQYCVIPMGSETLHTTLPLVKSVLIAGPTGSGKKMLVNAVCTEIGAVLFDLSPANIVGKYPGKPGLIMLIHLVQKMSKLLQPSIIWIDEAEKPFLKKVPKTDTTDPKRLKKDLPKLIKSLTPEDRVLVIGTTRCPWEADKGIMQAFQKHIIIPRPDYGTVSFLYRQYIRQFEAIGPFFDVSCISKLSDGYTVGEILNTLKSVLTTKRMLQLRVVPLSPNEIIVALSKHDPIFKEEDDAAEQFWWKTPIGKQKAAYMAEMNSGNKGKNKKK